MKTGELWRVWGWFTVGAFALIGGALIADGRYWISAPFLLVAAIKRQNGAVKRQNGAGFIFPIILLCTCEKGEA